MKEKTLGFEELSDGVIKQLREQHYKESTLIVLRRTFNRIHQYMKTVGVEHFSHEVGQRFLSSLHVSESYRSFFVCAIRRLEDYANGRPYRSHHGEHSESIVPVYSPILQDYLSQCRDKGNKTLTIEAKRKACTQFLNHLEKSGYSDISQITLEAVTQALLAYENKDNLARTRQFLKYIHEAGYVQTDFSSIVPRYKRPVPVITTYTPAEIKRLEDAIDTSSITGKRDRAIILLASRMGLRSGDIVKLRWSEIDLKDGYISLIQEKTSVPLSLRMPEDVIAALSDCLCISEPCDVNDGYVFHKFKAPYGPVTTGILRHVLNKYIHMAGIDIRQRKHGLHALRSSLASSMVNDGVSYETVRRILGHSDPDVIKRYAKANIENLRLCSLDPPKAQGLFADYLSGREAIGRV